MDQELNKQITPSFVKSQLDEILAREVIAFIDVDSAAATMSFNLTTISCITVIVGREREIKQYADFPPERYTRETFIKELVNIGLERDEDLEGAITAAIQKGYISQNETGEFAAEMAAFMMAGLLDTMFPGMQGLNLIAFVLQMNDEVNSGRKTLELAKQSFESSLKSSGVSVSRDHAEKRASELALGVQKDPVQTREISEKLKQENLERLSRLMKSRKKRSDDYTAKLKVTDLFQKGPSQEDLDARKIQTEKAEEDARQAADLARQLAEKDERIRQAQAAALQAEKLTKDLEEKELALKAAREKAAQAEKEAAELELRQARMAEKEAQLKAMEEMLKQKQDQANQELEARLQPAGEEEETTSLEDEDIESRIAAFESELAMVCPVCNTGEIEEKTTEKGKQFFTCSKKECRFVSWEKPYHFQCPLCKNPFLIEMQTMDGGKGLKCPRAACSYTQKNLLDPRQAQGVGDSTSTKKRKVVRRIKRR